jgi:hypothetical protein
MDSDGGGLLPDFLIIGAVKCGTTSFYYHLRDHPEVFCPSIKEFNYFFQGAGGIEPGQGPGDQETTEWVRAERNTRPIFRVQRKEC